MIRIVTFEAIQVVHHTMVSDTSWNDVQGKLVGTRKKSVGKKSVGENVGLFGNGGSVSNGPWDAISFFDQNWPNVNIPIDTDMKFGRVGNFFYFDVGDEVLDSDGKRSDSEDRGSFAFETMSADEADSFETWLEGKTGRSNAFLPDASRPHDRNHAADTMRLSTLLVSHQYYLSCCNKVVPPATNTDITRIPLEVYTDTD